MSQRIVNKSVKHSAWWWTWVSNLKCHRPIAPPPAGNNHIRCQSSGMGSPLSGSWGTGMLVFPTTWRSLKNPRVQSHFPGPPSVQPIPHREKCPATHGQYGGCKLHSEARWHQEQHTYEGSASYPRLGSDTSGRPENSICPSSTEPTCRQSKQNIHLEQQMVPES